MIADSPEPDEPVRVLIQGEKAEAAKSAEKKTKRAVESDNEETEEEERSPTVEGEEVEEEGSGDHVVIDSERVLVSMW